MVAFCATELLAVFVVEDDVELLHHADCVGERLFKSVDLLSCAGRVRLVVVLGGNVLFWKMLTKSLSHIDSICYLVFLVSFLVSIACNLLIIKCLEGELNPHEPCGPTDFKSGASADSATQADRI